MTSSMWTLILSIISGIVGAISAYFANKAASTAADIKKNGVTHIVAQITPSTPITPLKTVVIDGVTYTAGKEV